MKKDISLIVLPYGQCKTERIARVSGLVSQRWTDEVLFASINGASSFDGYSALVVFDLNEQLDIVKIDNLSKLYGIIKRIILLRDDNENNPPISWKPELFQAVEFYRDMFEGYGGLRKVGQLTTDVYPHKNTHIFNSASSTFADGFVYFPYGYIYRSLGHSGANELGFRVPANIVSLKKRSDNHKLIIFLGGSSCYDIFASTGERFSDKLELLLNENDNINQYTILNFGTPGNVLLNQIVTFILHVLPLRPDIVIAHDGFNDMVYGQCGDSFLLNKHTITYQTNFEEWACTLGGTKYEAQQRYLVKNSASVVIKAYLDRKQQFQDIVKKNGAIFISALQPSIWSKGELSDDEQKYLKRYYYDVWKNAFSRMPFLYQKLKSKIEQEHCFEHFVDIDSSFMDYGNDKTYLMDTCHTLPSGNDAIANTYYEYITSNIK